MVKALLVRNFQKHASKWVVLVIDLITICFAFVLAYGIRFNLSFDFNLNALIYQLPLVALIALLSFLAVGSYKGIIRHTGMRDTFNIFLGVTLFSASLAIVVLVNQVGGFFPLVTIPKSIILIHYLTAIFLLIISRFVFKALYEVIAIEVNAVKPVLIYGAGEAGIITYNALSRDTKYNYEVVAFIDDDPNKINKKIDRIIIHGPKKLTADFIKKHLIEEVVISTMTMNAERMLEITDIFLGLGVKIKVVPPLPTWIDGDLNTSQIKQINIDDLLGRDKIDIYNPVVRREVNNKVILVTGAAGSIGSEISRQLVTYDVQEVILLDQAESALYDLQQELHLQGYQNFTAIVADVRDKDRMRSIFEEHKPQYVYHAAAYKHVPLMEANPYEAIKINVLGTQKIADLAVEFHVQRFVMISTDKAVNPTNVMGATKRAAELYISCLSTQQKRTKFTTTRFGNVLGSNGSVIPLFKKQLENGGPLTVTHKEITRYFMTIPEACKLVLEAGTMGEGGEIYIFDMGKSVKIFDMAKRMIAFSGLQYPKDIGIKITGLRPGEKLYEELLATGENTIPTYHKKILIAKAEPVNVQRVSMLIEDLSREAYQFNKEHLVGILKTLVNEYVSNNSEFEKLDKKDSVS